MSHSARVLPLALRSARQAAGLSQAGLATAAHISEAYVAMLETGNRRHPSMLVVQALASACGVSVTDIAAIDEVMVAGREALVGPKDPPDTEC